MRIFLLTWEFFFRLESFTFAMRAIIFLLGISLPKAKTFVKPLKTPLVGYVACAVSKTLKREEFWRAKIFYDLCSLCLVCDQDFPIVYREIKSSQSKNFSCFWNFFRPSVKGKNIHHQTHEKKLLDLSSIICLITSFSMYLHCFKNSCK